VSGILCNTVDFNWKNEFLRNYDEYLRGTKCVETRSRVYFGFDDVVLEGYVLNVNIPYQSDAPYLVAFTFSLLITNYIDLSQTLTGYVKGQEDARSTNSKTSSDNEFVEYLTAIDSKEALVDFNTENGQWSALNSGSATADPKVFQDSSPAVAMSGLNNKEKLYLSSSEAMIKIDVDTQVQQKGTDRTTALLARVNDSGGSFPLSQRSDAQKSIDSSLSQKVAFGATVIKDQPDLS
jgi:hypothetical protein